MLESKKGVEKKQAYDCSILQAGDLSDRGLRKREGGMSGFGDSLRKNVS